MRARDSDEPVTARYGGTRWWLWHLLLAPAVLAVSIAQLAYGDERGVVAYLWIAGAAVATIWCAYAFARSRRGIELTRETLRVATPRRYVARLADVTHVALLHDRSSADWVLYVWVNHEPLAIRFMSSRNPVLPRDSTVPIDPTAITDIAPAAVARAIYDAARAAQGTRSRIGARATREFLEAENYGEMANAFWSPDGTYGRLDTLAQRWGAVPSDEADMSLTSPDAIDTTSGPPEMERGHARLMSAGLRRAGWVTVGLAVAGFLVSLAPSIAYDDAEQMIAHGVRTPGTVTAVHGDDLMEVAFEQGGVKRTMPIVRDSADDYTVGQAVTVVYDETKPARVRTTIESNPPMWAMQVGLWGMLIGAAELIIAIILLVSAWRATRVARAFHWRTCRFAVQLTNEKYAYVLVCPPEYFAPLRVRVRRRGPFGPAAALRDDIAHVVIGNGSRALLSVGGYLPVRARILAESEDEVVGRLSIASGA